MKKIYSTSYFHYTSSISKLEGILKEGFNAYYCKEQFKIDKEIKSFYIPMISFCDVPLSYIQQITYGDYAIGMKSSWGNNNSLFPILYFSNNQKNGLTNQILNAAKNFPEKSGKIDKYLIAYSKPKNKYESSNHCKDNYKERESRRVDINKISIDNKCHEKKCESLCLKFKVTDVAFIIVKNDEDRNKLLNNIKQFKTFGGKPFNNNFNIPILTKKEIISNF